MCGITGIFAFNMVGGLNMINLSNANKTQIHRGPDNFQLYHDQTVGLGHTRLAVLSPGEEGNQPMWDVSARYCIVYNGEIYNYQDFIPELEGEGVMLTTGTDTEVLLYLLIKHGKAVLPKLNGFFAFAFYDTQNVQVLLARDPMGIKPLYYYHDQDKFMFGSEMQSILAYGIEKEVDYTALLYYLQLNYVPAPYSMVKGVRKLLPGHYIDVGGGEVRVEKIPSTEEDPVSEGSLSELLESSVKKRLMSDVPLGSFLSGGVDSSIIAGLAARHTEQLHTFSVGYSDDKYFDETSYARKVARHIGSEHTVFELSRKTMGSNLEAVLDHFDEPFADSSAIAVYELSRQVRQQVTVALSGDGADELFGGYTKHRAWARAAAGTTMGSFVTAMKPLWWMLPKSRSSPGGNAVRRLHRFSKLGSMTPVERYWFLASFQGASDAQAFLSAPYQMEGDEVSERINALINDDTDSILRADQQLVLPDDMLKKVDLMSMASGLEVRVPFLDQSVVNWANRQPAAAKFGPDYSKQLLREEFSGLLPAEIFERSKKGFEVPLLHFLKKDLKKLVKEELLSKAFIQSQGIFDPGRIEQTKRQLYSMNPSDSHAKVWALLVFQWWWRKNFGG